MHARPMLNNSSPGQAVYVPRQRHDVWSGAEMTGRVCVGMALEPRYVYVFWRRWQVFTGKAACLHADARLFHACWLRSGKPPI